MPTSPPKPCRRCNVLVRDGSSLCEQHKVRPGQFGDKFRGSRQSRGYGAEWDKLRLEILKRDHGMCQCAECRQLGRLRLATQVDHVVNKAAWKRLHGSLSGVDDPSNLQAIHKDCHDAKTAREALEGRG